MAEKQKAKSYYETLKEKMRKVLAPIEPAKPQGVSSRRLDKQLDPETGEPYNTINNNGRR